MRTTFAAGLLALVPLAAAAARPPITQTPAAQSKPAGPPPAPAQPAAGPPKPGVPDAPMLPPFAGEIVNFDRRGTRTVACVDAAKVQLPPRPGPDGKPVAPPPAPPSPPRVRIWIIEREVMQELMTTSGLCDPAWAPDGKTFAAAGARGVFTFSEPNFEPRVVVAGQMQPPPPGAAVPAREYEDPTWSPSGARLAFRSTAAGAARVEVVDVRTAEVLLKRDGPAKSLRWGDDRTLVIDGTRVPVP
jgi:hypothetical protein